ncbi:sialidase-1-like [Amphiura filiformis]|uniref:sialidase-1-like n=1 Tax=Amphiura filiformis TaxID=82378 RepID=UPI003B20F913
MYKLQIIYCLISCSVISFISATINPVIYEEQVIWVSGQQAEIKEYRTPIVIRTPPGDILAFAAGRKVSGGDASAKMITMRRSTDGGSSFDTTEVIVDDGDATPDGLNLGNIIIDKEKGSIIILYCFCVRDRCNPRRPASVFMTRSFDWGYSWTPPVDLGVKSKDFEGWHWCPGPGYGIQKMHAPKKGRLIACGHSIGFPKLMMICIYSDDHGDTWHKGAHAVGLPYGVDKNAGDFAPSEPQMIELPNGTLLFNVRNEKHFHCKCRMWFTSTDGGHTFPIEQLRMDATLVDPSCQGSLLLHNNITFFSNPASESQRVNMTLRWSFDYGMSVVRVFKCVQQRK